MNICGIITEYNPFHNGHELHVEKSRELSNADGIVCIMSGNFAQRGIPCIVDKWNRTEMALKNGVDLVIELPTVYSVSSAEFFSHGAVSLLNSIGCISHLCFGSELGDVSTLENIANILALEPVEYKTLLKSSLNQGLNFPQARNQALFDYITNNGVLNNLSLDDLTAILNSSNNILGIEYLKSLTRLNSSITPLTITREGSSYNDNIFTSSFASATSIRRHIKNKNDISELEKFMPSSAYEHINHLDDTNYNFTFEDSMFKYIKYKCLTSPNTLKNLPDASEGLDNKLIDCILKYDTLSEVLETAKSKRYTLTRLSRILCQYFIGLDEIDMAKERITPPTYVRVLGFNSKGKEILATMKKTSSIPIVSNVTKKHSYDLAIDLQATRAYSILNPNISPIEDFKRTPIILGHKKTHR